MLDALRDQPHPVPDDEDARRHWDTLAGVDEDPITAGEQRLHRVAFDGDDAQVCRAGPELVADHPLGKEPDLLDLLQALVNGARTRRGADVDLRDPPEAFRDALRRQIAR